MKKIKKKSAALIAGAAMMAAAGVVSAGFQTLADSDVKSRGNFILEGEEINICAEDIDYLQGEMTLLSDEVSDLQALLSETGKSRKDEIHSKGVIDYAQGTVVMDSADLTDLANGMDELEAAYKKNTVEALNQIGTYYKSDGSVTHSKEEEAISAENALSLTFHAISEGVKQSQSVAHLAARQAMDAADTPLFYANEDAANNNNLVEITTENNDFPVFTQPAAAGNLTAGTAAWVNGSLIIGNGADNDSFYQKGYTQGYDEGYIAGGRDVIKNMYANEAMSKEYDSIVTFVSLNSESKLGTEKEDRREETYEIPLVNEQGGILYAISFTYNYSAFQIYEQASNASGSYELSTKEGSIIESDSKSFSHGATGAYDQKISVNVNIDLFEKNFSTDENSLYLNLNACSQGHYRNSSLNAIALARFEFVDIRAKYK